MGGRGRDAGRKRESPTSGPLLKRVSALGTITKGGRKTGRAGVTVREDPGGQEGLKEREGERGTDRERKESKSKGKGRWEGFLLCRTCHTQFTLELIRPPYEVGRLEVSNPDLRRGKE